MLTGTGGWTGILFWVINMGEDTKLIATGEKWVGYGVRSFSSVTAELMEKTKKELVMTIYMLSDMDIVHNLLNALERGISVTIFIYAPQNPQEREAIRKLNEMNERYEYLRIHRVDEEMLHAKVLVSDRANVLMGSANATFGGMVRNYELGMFLADRKIAHRILELLWRLVN